MTAAELWRYLAARDDYPETVCWAWVENLDKRCDYPAGEVPRLCDLHAKAAERHHQEVLADAKEDERRRRQRDLWSAEMTPVWECALAVVEKQIGRLSPSSDDKTTVGGEARAHDLAYLDIKRHEFAARLHAAREARARIEANHG